MDTVLLSVIILITVALIFDFINGFHDAANSIATIVATRVLTPGKAVICNASESMLSVLSEMNLTKVWPHFATRDVAPTHKGADPAIWNAIGAAGTVDRQRPLISPIADFYLTNPVARSSETMAECSRLFVQQPKMAAE